jgi:hypothetical protein
MHTRSVSEDRADRQGVVLHRAFHVPTLPPHRHSNCRESRSRRDNRLDFIVSLHRLHPDFAEPLFRAAAHDGGRRDHRDAGASLPL